MNYLLSTLLTFLKPLFNTRAAGVYLLIFAAAIGTATFIENDFGTSAAQKVIFRARWFELLMLLFSGTIVVNIIKFRMIQQKKWALLLFHGAMLVILLGAGITRYAGFEGMMHIRENDTSNRFLSSNPYLIFEAQKGEQRFAFDEAVWFASLGRNHFEEEYVLGGDLVSIKLKQFIPNPKPVLYESMEGKPLLQLVIGGANGREEYFLSAGETQRINGLVYNFTSQFLPGAVNLRWQGDSLQIVPPTVMTQTVMATQIRDTLYPEAGYQPLQLRALYSDGSHNFVFADFRRNGKVRVESEDPKVRNESLTAVVLEVSGNGTTEEVMVYGRKGQAGQPETLHLGDLHLSVSYGAKLLSLPFSLKLYDFQLERYPGTNSPASFASEVQLIDPRSGLQEDYRIYMNNILTHDGYRFFQSSYDRDEIGTYLSVNHDYWGSLISYLGYGILTLGMLMTFVSKRTRFHQVSQQLKKIRAKRTTLLLFPLLLLSLIGRAQSNSSPTYLDQVVDADHAQRFSQLVVQDFKGRMKPVHTLSREILRKVARTEKMYGLSADQILLSLFANGQAWYAAPLIKLGKHEKLRQELGLSEAEPYAAYRDFFAQDGSYKLRDAVRRANTLDPVDRGVYDKEIMKIDERVNILRMTFGGSLLSVVPNPSDPNHSWISAQAQAHNHDDPAGDHYVHVAENFFQAYHRALLEGIQTGNYGSADNLLTELEGFQQQQGGEVLPSPAKIRAEILLNQSRVFQRLLGLYLLLGLSLLFLLFFSVFQPQVNLRTAYLLLFSLVAAGFAMHTIGLGLRWFVSGRAPWSNGYESMIYIAWTTTLAGLLFTRKSFGGLAATMVLAATILFVATLSFLDPEITPLVPVLRSYWLTIHVSLEAGSYGFLMLGAIIGLINLILMTLLRESNRDRIKEMIQEMSYLSELTLVAGLFMISIGTYLGGVWANESWGRYWGWDAKETWALVTILIYAFILHMRIIPKLFGLFSYNLGTIFGLASVLMTYYGVNYYLSGLHSYATGDPVPVPSWVYVAVGVIVLIASLAFVKKRKYLGKR